MREVTIYRTPLLTLDQNATAGGGLVEVVKLADHDAALRRAKAEGMREAAKVCNEWHKIDRTHIRFAIDMAEELGRLLDARAAQIEEGEST